MKNQKFKMKKLLIILIVILPTLIFASHDSYVSLEWGNVGSPANKMTPIKYCDEYKTVNFRVGFSYGHGAILYPNSGNCGINGEGGSNPYKYLVKLYRDNVLIAQQEFRSSSCKMNVDFENILAEPGEYKATVNFKLKTWGLWWSNQGTTNSNIIPTQPNNPIPNFDINGIQIPTDGSAIQVNVAQIRLNAAACQCETEYRVIVEECDPNNNLTSEYSWEKRFFTQAPDNLNLQQLTTSYSIPPYYSGLNSRQGSPMISGQLSNGSDRHYRVSVCMWAPNYACKSALVRVNY